MRAQIDLNPDGTRRHMRASLDAGVTRDEILMVLKMVSVMSMHSCSLGGTWAVATEEIASCRTAILVDKARNLPRRRPLPLTKIDND